MLGELEAGVQQQSAINPPVADTKANRVKCRTAQQMRRHNLRPELQSHCPCAKCCLTENNHHQHRPRRGCILAFSSSVAITSIENTNTNKAPAMYRWPISHQALTNSTGVPGYRVSANSTSTWSEQPESRSNRASLGILIRRLLSGIGAN